MTLLTSVIRKSLSLARDLLPFRAGQELVAMEAGTGEELEGLEWIDRVEPEALVCFS